jgi:arylsulfatase A-like enzyme
MSLRSRFTVTRLLVSAVSVLAMTMPSSSVIIAADRPNVLVILCDDLGFSDLGCYGSEIATPNLDQLAANGLRFSQFYNAAKCESTRSTILSGLYHNETNTTKLAYCRTIAETMQAAGYHTMMSGKWHMNGQPTERGFERYFGHLSGSTNYFIGDNTFYLDGKRFAIPDKFYTTEAVTDYAIKFIGERPVDKPFFFYLAYNAPHYPLQAPEADVRKYLDTYKRGWDDVRKARYDKQRELGLFAKPCELSQRPNKVNAWDKLSNADKEWEDKRMATFAAMVDIMDRNIGRLVAYLKQQGQLDNTLILFLSDNGGCPFDRTTGKELPSWDSHSHWAYDEGWAHVANTPFRWYKQNQHEGGISTPMIAHWPMGITAKPGSITDQIGHIVDIYATAMDLAGTTRPDTFDGQVLKPLRGLSLAPIFKGETRTPHEALYFDYGNKNHALRMGQWKLVAVNGGEWELYDMDADRSELHNLAKQMPERVSEMTTKWNAWAKQAGIGGGKKKEDKE